MSTPDHPDLPKEKISGYQWMVFAIASAGWVFDVYEGQLFAIFKSSALKDLLGIKATIGEGDTAALAAMEWHGNIALALFLVGGAIGGLFFGMLGDRIGRVRVLSLTILTYSIFSALTFFVRDVYQLHALRLLVALGVGGEWAVAASLVAETFPERSRALASGTFHALSVLGVVLASLTGMLLTGPGAWRWGFLLGLAPALLTFWIRLRLKEPEGWRQARETAALGQKFGSLTELLGDRRAWIGLGLASIGLGTYWGIYAWAPELVKDVLGPNVPEAERQSSASFVYMMMNFTGGLLGLLVVRALASWLGRRGTFAIYHVAAVILVPLTFLGSTTLWHTMLLLPLMAFFVVGMHAGYAIYFPELFPTRLRATGSSFCFNVGRLLGAGMLLVRGQLGVWYGMRHAVVLMSSLFLVGLVLLIFAPETRGQKLPE